jgi:hypothetical protein
MKDTAGQSAPHRFAAHGVGRRSQDSRCRKRGIRLLCDLGPETVADRLGQSRLIHLLFYDKDNLSFDLGRVCLFHPVTFFRPKFQIVLDSNMLINKWTAKKSITGYWVRGE